MYGKSFVTTDLKLGSLIILKKRSPSILSISNDFAVVTSIECLPTKTYVHKDMKIGLMTFALYNGGVAYSAYDIYAGMREPNGLRYKKVLTSVECSSGKEWDGVMVYGLSIEELATYKAPFNIIGSYIYNKFVRNSNAED